VGTSLVEGAERVRSLRQETNKSGKFAAQLDEIGTTEKEGIPAKENNHCPEIKK